MRVINGEKLIDLLIEHQIGVRQKAIDILELDADAFAQLDENLKVEAEWLRVAVIWLRFSVAIVLTAQ